MYLAFSILSKQRRRRKRRKWEDCARDVLGLEVSHLNQCFLTVRSIPVVAVHTPLGLGRAMELSCFVNQWGIKLHSLLSQYVSQFPFNIPRTAEKID